MSFQRTPLRTRSSMGNLGGGNQGPTSSTKRTSEIRRPPSRTTRPGSSSNSRPGSAMGNIAGSRSSTPSFMKPEPYTGSIIVSIRPNPYSFDQSQSSPWLIQPSENSISNINDGASYVFDNVFSADTSLTNYEVYQKSCSQIVDNFLNNGYNGTIFAYGMTGSGKTYSMKGDDHNPGIVRLAIEDIFKKINSNSINMQYNLHISYLEIYNEKIVDLLNPGFNGELKIRDDAQYGTKIVGITSTLINTKENLINLINKGDSNRKTSTTDFNARSSRSHSVLQLRLSCVDLINSTEQNSTLSLCDLAGSERATSSVERRKEGSYINKSLLALSTVINKLSASTPGMFEHIPYRDSKLTRLLQPALSGASLVSILCTIHLGSTVNNHFLSETYNTLRFAARAKDVVINVNKNKSTSFGDIEALKLIEDLKKTIENQKNELNLLRITGNQPQTDPSISNQNARIAELQAENTILTEKLDHYSKLVDLQRTETVILKNDTLNDILGTGSDSSQMMMANLEDFYNKVTYEASEYKMYIKHLENQLKVAYQQNNFLQLSSSNNENHDSKVLQQVLKEQEEEIYNLKESLKDKDHIIKNLTKTTKLRRLVDSNNDTPIKNEPRIRKLSDKENNYELREFNTLRKLDANKYAM